MVKLLKRALAKRGWVVLSKASLDEHRETPRMDLHANTEFMELYERCRPYTMTSMERMYGLYEAVRYVSSRRVQGDVVECGVWRGGSAMLCALALLRMQEISRRIYLYDTFDGMPEPSERDVDYQGRSVDDVRRDRGLCELKEWRTASLEEVKENMLSTGYPAEKVRFVKGLIEETIPGTVPERISVLRLDTDWYGSTYHELNHLYPRLCEHGVLVVDDYGHWKGAREATDQYFREHDLRLFVGRLDYSGRVVIKS